MKRAAPDDDKVITTSNGFNGKKLMSFIKDHQKQQRQIERIATEKKDAQHPYRQEQAAIIKRAAEAGFSKTEFRTVLAKHRKEYELEHVADHLDLEQKSNYELMIEALGQLADTDLGRAAVDATQ